MKGVVRANNRITTAIVAVAVVFAMMLCLSGCESSASGGHSNSPAARALDEAIGDERFNATFASNLKSAGYDLEDKSGKVAEAFSYESSGEVILDKLQGYYENDDCESIVRMFEAFEEYGIRNDFAREGFKNYLGQQLGASRPTRNLPNAQGSCMRKAVNMGITSPTDSMATTGRIGSWDLPRLWKRSRHFPTTAHPSCFSKKDPTGTTQSRTTSS